MNDDDMDVIEAAELSDSVIDDLKAEIAELKAATPPPNGMVRVTLDLTPREARFLWHMILDCQDGADAGYYYPDDALFDSKLVNGESMRWGAPVTLDEWTELAEKIARQIKGISVAV